MNPASLSEQQHHILFDSDVISQIVPQWFTIEYWQDRAQIQPAARGRGRAWFIDTPEHSMVLRHYQRGGAMAALLGDKYLWHGLSNTRAWCEWHLLADLWRLGLPVPQPLAAHVVRTGLYYRADLLTSRIADTQSLSDYLLQEPLAQTGWQAMGKVIRRFHQANVNHADLNAHNILLDKSQGIYLIDFDKGQRMRDSGGVAQWQQANLQRLQRSLNKLRFEDPGFHFRDSDWQLLMDVYGSK